jgi:hypothetical protein
LTEEITDSVEVLEDQQGSIEDERTPTPSSEYVSDELLESEGDEYAVEEPLAESEGSEFDLDLPPEPESRHEDQDEQPEEMTDELPIEDFDEMPISMPPKPA